MRRRRAIAAGLAAAALLVGCRDSDPERAVAVVRGFVEALARRDGAGACEHLAEAGVSELLLSALEADVPVTTPEASGPEPCAVVAERLAEQAPGLADLRSAPVGQTVIHGDRASVHTHAGSYELEEVEGRWRLTRFEPVARRLAGAPAPARPVHISVSRPRLREPALGPALAGRTDEETVEITGSLSPSDARLSAEMPAGARIEEVRAADGTFRVVARLREGPNHLVLRAHAPGHDPTELAVRLMREPGCAGC